MDEQTYAQQVAVAHDADLRARLEAAFNGMAQTSPLANFTCGACEDTEWIFCILLPDGSEIRERRKIRMESEIRGRELMAERVKDWVERCPECFAKLRIAANSQVEQKRNDEKVTLALLAKEYKGRLKQEPDLKDPVPFARAIAEASTLIVGDSGSFKTGVLQYWWNRLLHKRGHEGMLWLTETDLVRSFKKDGGESMLATVRKAQFVFLNECFTREAWLSASGEGSHNQNVTMGMTDFWDFFYSNRQVVIYCDANTSPDERIDPALYARTLRRVGEIFGDGERVIRL